MSVPGASKPKARATCWAWPAIAPWRCSTNFGALVVPEVVKMLHGALGAAWLAPIGGRDSRRSNGTRRSRSMAGGAVAGSSPITTMALQAIERGRLDVGEDRQEIDPPEARRAGQHLGARAADDVGDLDRAIARVHRDGDGAQPRAGEIEDRIGRHVGQPQRHTIARPDAEIGEALRRARCLLVQLREGDRPFAVKEGGGAWASPPPSGRGGSRRRKRARRRAWRAEISPKAVDPARPLLDVAKRGLEGFTCCVEACLLRQ